jgi:hypothetical protein
MRPWEFVALFTLVAALGLWAIVNRRSGGSVRGRVIVPGISIAFANLALLALLIGWVGASRAYSVGVHTLFRDHLPTVAATLVATALLAGVLGGALRSPRELWLVIGVALGADLVAALAVTLSIDEMRRFPDLARALFAETAGGLQLLAVAIGAIVGHVAHSDLRRP